jgi:hypothetical protein
MNPRSTTPGPFVTAVMAAEKAGMGEFWDFIYFAGPHKDYHPSRRETYMHGRRVALGPEWDAYQRWVLRAEGKIDHIQLDDRLQAA